MTEIAKPSSTRPYLIRALYDWCVDNHLTPHLVVKVEAQVQVPREYVKNNEIVLNIGFEAVSALKLGNEWIEFKARFAGVAREIMVPVSHVLAIYARENGQGMAFTQRGVDAANTDEIQPIAQAAPAGPSSSPPATPGKPIHLFSVAPSDPNEPPPPKSPSKRPNLTRVK